MAVFVLRILIPAAFLAAGWFMYDLQQEQVGLSGQGTRSHPQLIAIDSSGHGNDGVNQGRPIVGLPGFRGTAYSFRRDGSWIQVPANAVLNPGRHDFRMSAWVNFRVAPGEGETYDVIRKGVSFTAGGEFKLEIAEGGRVHCSAKGSTGRVGQVFTNTVAIADGRWHRITCARVGGTWRVIVDGHVTSVRVRLGFLENGTPMSIGSKYGREDGFPGRIDEVRYAVDEGNDGLLDTRRQPEGLWHLDEEAWSMQHAGPPR